VRNDRERLLDIVEAIDRIARHTRSGRTNFEEQELVQTWVIHHIEIIGEAASRVSDELQARHRGIPWREMAAMRNVLAHDYFGIDVDLVWSTVENDLPRLRDQIEAVLREPDPG
jgi:uncharacterized protein with HEPN domain